MFHIIRIEISSCREYNCPRAPIEGLGELMWWIHARIPKFNFISFYQFCPQLEIDVIYTSSTSRVGFHQILCRLYWNHRYIYVNYRHISSLMSIYWELRRAIDWERTVLGFLQVVVDIDEMPGHGSRDFYPSLALRSWGSPPEPGTVSHRVRLISCSSTPGKENVVRADQRALPTWDRQSSWGWDTPRYRQAS